MYLWLHAGWSGGGRHPFEDENSVIDKVISAMVRIKEKMQMLLVTNRAIKLYLLTIKIILLLTISYCLYQLL